MPTYSQVKAAYKNLVDSNKAEMAKYQRAKDLGQGYTFYVETTELSNGTVRVSYKMDGPENQLHKMPLSVVDFYVTNAQALDAWLQDGVSTFPEPVGV